MTALLDLRRDPAGLHLARCAPAAQQSHQKALRLTARSRGPVP
jgi:hypothetical protein